MDKYSPILGANTDPHYIVKAMAIEAKEGRGPFYLDCSPMKPEDRELMTPKGGWMALNYQKLLDMGMNFFEDKLEWELQLRMPVGGIVADIEGNTSVPGLFVTGTARATDPAVYMGGWNLCLCAVTGYITGKSAARYAKSRKPSQIDENEVQKLKNNLFAPLQKEGMPPKKVLTETQKAAFPYDVCILKNETSLKKALSKIGSIRDELLPQLQAKDAHYLMKLIEVRSIAFVAELFLRASLMRTESRAGHYREDYPRRDDKNWLQWIIISRQENKLKLSTKPVPFDKYKFKITRCYSDNFDFTKSG